MVILIEGVPGAGKSSTAHFLEVHCADHDVPARWWYEEERGHPVYCFHDADSIRAVVADLFGGRHERVVADALAQWERFAAIQRPSETTVILDGALFGYLTWSLFPIDVPEARIGEYVARVEEIVRWCEPRLIYLRQSDLAGSLERICSRRGAAWAKHLIARSTENAYARRHGWRGVDGMVAYYSAYQNMVDRLFARSPLPKLSITGASGDWPAAHRQIADFLSLPSPRVVDSAGTDLRRYAGRYERQDGADRLACEVRLEDNGLVASGPPGMWDWNRLVPRTADRFYVDSLPFEFAFEPDASGTIRTLTVSGPEIITRPTRIVGVYARV